MLKAIKLFTIIILAFFEQNALCLSDYPGTEIKNWEYIEGDLDITKNLDVQIRRQTWKKAPDSLRPEIDSEHKNIWMRARLDLTFGSNTLYIRSIDQVFEVYGNGKLIYKNGSLNKEGRGKFIDWRRHYIPITPSLLGNFIYFRLYSDYSAIGFYGTPLLTNKAELITNMQTSEIPAYISSACLIVLGALSLILVFVSSRSNLFLFSISLLGFSGGTFLLTRTSFLTLHFPNFDWIKVEFLSLSLIPIGYLLYLSTFAKNKLKKVFLITCGFNGIISLITLLHVILKGLEVHRTLLTIEVGLILSLLIALPLIAIGAFQGAKTFKVILFGAAFAAVGILFDIYVTLAALDDSNRVGFISGFILFVSLAYAAGIQIKEHYNRTIRLQEEKEKQKTLEFKKRMEVVTTFSAGVAHEINNPLAIIHGYVSKLERDIETKKDLFHSIGVKFDYIPKITNSILRIKNITSSLLLVATSSETGQIELTANQMIDDAIQKSYKLAEAQSVALVVKKIPENIILFCDKEKFNDAIFSVVCNAIEAASNTSNKWVELEFSSNGSSFYILISDSGAGIPNEIENKIFDPFFTTKEVGHGTGLGLSVALKVVEFMGGSIKLMDNSESTTFRVSIPCNIIDESISHPLAG